MEIVNEMRDTRLGDCMQQVSSSDTNLLKHNMKPDNKNDNQVSLGLGPWVWEEELSLITRGLSPEKFFSAPADCFRVLSGVQ